MTKTKYFIDYVNPECSYWDAIGLTCQGAEDATSKRFVFVDGECMTEKDSWSDLDDEYDDYLWDHDMDRDDFSVLDYLNLATGARWDSMECYGYYQRDWVKIIYCQDVYSEQDIEILGDMWTGCFKEFCVTFQDGPVYGYYVTDTEGGWRPEDCKRIVCELAGIPEDETALRIPCEYGDEEYEII